MPAGARQQIALYEMLAEKTIEYTDEGKWAAVQHESEDDSEGED